VSSIVIFKVCAGFAFISGTLHAKRYFKSTILNIPTCISLTVWRRIRTGTSQAVPYVAGVMALVLQNSSVTSPEEMEALIVRSAVIGRLSEANNSPFSSFVDTDSHNLLLQSTISVPIEINPWTIKVSRSSCRFRCVSFSYCRLIPFCILRLEKPGNPVLS
jgi:hypothetical protein